MERGVRWGSGGGWSGVGWSAVVGWGGVGLRNEENGFFFSLLFFLATFSASQLASQEDHQEAIGQLHRTLLHSNSLVHSSFPFLLSFLVFLFFFSVSQFASQEEDHQEAIGHTLTFLCLLFILSFSPFFLGFFFLFPQRHNSLHKKKTSKKRLDSFITHSCILIHLFIHPFRFSFLS